MQPPPLQSLSDLYPPAQHASTWDLFTTLWIENPTSEWSIYGSLNGPESSPVWWQNLIWSLWCCAKVREQQQGARTHLRHLHTLDLLMLTGCPKCPVFCLSEGIRFYHLCRWGSQDFIICPGFTCMNWLPGLGRCNTVGWVFYRASPMAQIGCCGSRWLKARNT